MDLATLDANNQLDRPVEGYSSLIWTERFNTVGDFQLSTGDVGGFMSRLPQKTLLSLRETNIVMEVETHKIERKKNTPDKLTITGRAWESILDRRAAVKALTDISDWIVNLKTPSDLAWYIINQICVMGIADPADIFPGARVQFPAPADFDTSTGPVKALAVERGNLLATVLKLIQTETIADPTTTPATPAVVPHGIRAVRPNSSGTAVGIQIYSGVDRSATVRFDATREKMEDGNYLFSKVGSADTAYILGTGTSAKMNKRSVASTGFDRRVILVDGTTSGLSDLETLKAQGAMSLSEAKETSIFDGSIDQNLSEYVYGVDYGLGDIVTTVGDYGLTQKARVTEYIRTEDATGSKAYPTLVAIPS